MLNNVKKQLDRLENYLYDQVYVNFAQIPEYITRPIIKFLSLISLILGLLCLLDAYGLWHAAHNASTLITYANNYSNLYGVPKVPINHHMGLAFWLGIVILLIEAYVFIKAASLVKKQPKQSWRLIYYAFVLNVVYGIVILFSYFGGLGTLLERLLFSFAGLYFLFEIRDDFFPLTPEKKPIKKKKKS